jgi:hypothetical protein
MLQFTQEENDFCVLFDINLVNLITCAIECVTPAAEL